MVDYKYKSEILRSGLPGLVREIDRAFYADVLLHETGEVKKTKMNLDTAKQMRCFLIEKDSKAYDEAVRINDARRQKTARARSVVSSLLETHDTVIFATFTFRDDVLASTSPKTRREYLRRFLSAYAVDFVGNIDFGGKNGREHYHVVIGCRIKPSSWQYGACNVQLVRSADKNVDSARLSKYISKLSNHAIKENACGTRLMISRVEEKYAMKNRFAEFSSECEIMLQSLRGIDVKVDRNQNVRFQMNSLADNSRPG